MTTGTINDFKIDNEETEIVQNFTLLGSIINQRGDYTKEIRRRPILRRTAMKELEAIIKDKNVKLETMIKIVRAMVFPLIMYGCDSWTTKKADRKKIDSFKWWCWRRVLRILWTVRNVNKWILDQIKPEMSLEARVTRLKLSYFGHIMRRHDSLEKTIMLEGSRGRGRPNTRWINSIKETTDANLKVLSGVTENRTFWRSLIYGVAIGRQPLDDT